MGEKNKEIDVAQQISFLKKISFFQNFDEHELRQFLGVSKWLKVPPGKVIIRENTVEKVFYILVRGTVSVFKTLASEETVELTRLSTGDCFGEMALVSETKRTAGVKTTTDSYILRVEPDIISTSNVFLQVKFYKRFCEILVTRLILANERVIKQRQTPEEPGDRSAIAQAANSELSMPAAAAVSAEVAEIPAMPEKKEKVSLASLRRMVEGNLRLPVNPAVAAELTDFIETNQDNTRRLAELVMLDPVVSARVLQLANSPFYRRTCAIATIPHAMITVGIKDIKKVVAETIADSREVVPFHSAEMARRFWQHSLAVGRIAQFLKEVIRLTVSTEVHMAGLLHDLGTLAIDALEPRLYPQLQRPDNGFDEDICQAETEYVGVDHAIAGAWLAERLGLPQVYLEVMKFHHEPENVREHALSVALIHLAELFARRRGVCLDKAAPPPVESFAWVLIQEQHRPFMEVNLADFVIAFENELTKVWDEMIGGVGS